MNIIPKLLCFVFLHFPRVFVVGLGWWKVVSGMAINSNYCYGYQVKCLSENTVYAALRWTEALRSVLHFVKCVVFFFSHLLHPIWTFGVVWHNIFLWCTLSFIVCASEEIKPWLSGLLSPDINRGLIYEHETSCCLSGQLHYIRMQ